ncbi:hypothetical protein Hanom_Chr00s058171g01783921 [Helianthus anomalus]
MDFRSILPLMIVLPLLRIGGSKVGNISMAIHPHTLFLLYAHGDQLTHRPFFLLSVVVDLECFKG